MLSGCPRKSLRSSISLEVRVQSKMSRFPVQKQTCGTRGGDHEETQCTHLSISTCHVCLVLRGGDQSVPLLNYPAHCNLHTQQQQPTTATQHHLSAWMIAMIALPNRQTLEYSLAPAQLTFRDPKQSVPQCHRVAIDPAPTDGKPAQPRPCACRQGSRSCNLMAASTVGYWIEGLLASCCPNKIEVHLV